MSKRAGLGRGIGALIPTEGPTDAEPSKAADSRQSASKRNVSRETSVKKSSPIDVFFTEPQAAEDLAVVPGARLLAISPSDIRPNSQQPRQVFDEEELAQLEHSIREFGVFQPIVVRPIEGAKKEPHFELIMGERRWRATQRAGLSEIPAVVKDTPDDAMLRDALLENLHRAQLNPLEEASAYQQLMDDFGITQEQLAERIGRSRPQISNTIRLLRLPETVQARVAAGVLSAGHARAILSADTVEAMEQVADKIVNEDLSVRAAEAIVTQGERTTRSKPKKGSVQRGLNEVAERLTDRLDTRVRVSLGRSKGQIVVDFQTVAELNRILRELGEEPFGDAQPLQ
ncbi:ParB/RepB/Spo0J family partition protein [uncultured Agrococcus sp.]|uniref:ParB/RepB/Spo0J family partition protein n=1 Tax=uncultured Agrococcus sp. TaxID=382258 RepID=UPI0025DEFE63|nr:ParB/RepB/Spo0J family partition protein [uncultured Agrococcus sp.]